MVPSARPGLGVRISLCRDVVDPIEIFHVTSAVYDAQVFAMRELCHRSWPRSSISLSCLGHTHRKSSCSWSNNQSWIRTPCCICHPWIVGPICVSRDCQMLLTCAAIPPTRCSCSLPFSGVAESTTHRICFLESVNVVDHCYRIRSLFLLITEASDLNICSSCTL